MAIFELMKNNNQDRQGDYPDPEDPGDGVPEADLWFLPGPDTEDEADAFAPPLPRAPRQGLVDLAAWRAAEAALAQPLAALSRDLGRLIERAESLGPQAGMRLAQAEAAALSWGSGARISADRIALWSGLRIGASGADGEALIRIAWAARRLAAPRPVGEGQGRAIAAHLGLRPGDPSDLVEEFAAALPEPGALGPVATGCLAGHLWRALDERAAQQRDIEAAVLGARLAIGFDSAALGFLPLARTGMGALRAGGTPEQRLSAWISGARDAVRTGLMALADLQAWRSRAAAGTAGLSGRTPRLLIEALARHVMVAVPQLVAETGASRPAVERNLAILEQRGLVREVTGQGRYRVWAAKG